MNISDNYDNFIPSLVKGLNGIYALSKSFLNTVHPDSTKNLYDELNLTVKENLEIDLNHDKAKDWHFWTGYYSGIFACIIIGLLYIILQPIIILLYSYCRCCGCCGANSKFTYLTKSKKCLKSFLSILLLLLSVFMLGGTICAFMSNEKLHEITKESSDANFTNSITKCLTTSQNRLNSFLSEIPKGIKPELKRLNTSLSMNLTNFTIEKEFMDVLVKTDIYADLAHIENDLKTLCSNVSSLYAQINKTKASVSKVNSSAIALDEKIKNCSQCGSIETPNFKTEDFDSSILEENDFDHRCKSNSINKVINDTLGDSLGNVQDEIQASLFDAMNEVEKPIENINDYVNQSQNQLNDGVSKALTFSKEYSPYTKYGYYALIALSSVILLIILVNVLGSSFGLCASSRNEISRNNVRGSNLLCCNLVLMFLFTFMMLPVIILFMLGGFLQIESCRGLENKQNNTLVKLADDMMMRNLNISNFNLLKSLENCENDQGLINAFQLKDFLLSQVNYKALIREKISSVDVSLPGLTSEKVFKNVTGFDNLLPNVSLSAKIEEFNNSLIVLHHNITQIAGKIFEDDFKAVWADLAEVNDDTVKLESMINSLKDFLKNSSISEENMDEFKGSFDANINKTLSSMSGSFKEKLIILLTAILDSFLTETFNNLGKCKPIYMVYNDFRALLCDHFIANLNSFWFSFGWCVTCFFPATILIFFLINLYNMRNIPDNERELFNLVARNRYKASVMPSAKKSEKEKVKKRAKGNDVYENLTNDSTLLTGQERNNFFVY